MKREWSGIRKHTVRALAKSLFFTWSQRLISKPVTISMQWYNGSGCAEWVGLCTFMARLLNWIMPHNTSFDLALSSNSLWPTGKECFAISKIVSSHNWNVLAFIILGVLTFCTYISSDGFYPQKGSLQILINFLVLCDEHVQMILLSALSPIW